MENIGIHTEPAKAQLLSEPITFDLGRECQITIDAFVNADKESVYRVKWIDYIANEWNEYYCAVNDKRMYWQPKNQIERSTKFITFKEFHED